MSTPTESLPKDSFANVAPEPLEPAPLPLGPDNPPWHVPGAIGFWLLSVALILFMPVFFVVPYILRQEIGMEGLSGFLLTDKTAIFLQVVSTIPAHLLTLGAAWLLVTRVGKFPFLAMLGWTWDAKYNFWRSTAIAVGLYLVGISLIYFLDGPETPLNKILNSSRLTAVTVAFMATATAPLVEEIIYRGVLYSALQRAIGARLAIWIVLILFALVHVPQYLPNYGILFIILLLSTVLTIVRARTGKLLPCFIIHLVFNGVQSVLIVLEPYFRQYLPEQMRGAESAIVLASLFGVQL
ncbi:MAG TPA: CPBP family intramembrane glutamic endopeptidase [Pyrinomonadaceae bacterium]|nr:CPBP family intramembrane glutamic endopeptidase [Pyrinomonadaceae bacterium]